MVKTNGLGTSYRFDYIPQQSYEANVGAGEPGFKGALKVPAGFEAKLLASAVDQEAVQRVGGLSAGTTYLYRLVAKNANGEDIGPERTITTQEAAPVFSLAEGRGWEMVTPVDKNGGAVAAPGTLFGGGAFQARALNGSVTYSSASSFAQSAGNPGASQYVATRGGGGWTTENVTLPTSAGAFPAEPDGVPFRLFSPELGLAVVLTASDSYALAALESAPSELWQLDAHGLTFAGASLDLQHVVLSTCEALTSDASEVPGPDGCDPGATNLYEVSDAGLRLLNIGPGESEGTPGASLAAQGANAVSQGGQRIYFVDDAGALVLRDGGQSVLVDPDGAFQAASADGSIAYFAKASHLYRFSLGAGPATDLTPVGGVLGVFGTSSDGSRVYFEDATGVKMWSSGTVTTIADRADPSSFPPSTGTARVSQDGEHLAFLSTLPLTGYDGGGATEAYLYSSSSDSLLCASCNPTGARATGDSWIPGATGNGTQLAAYKSRAMSDDGSRLFFETEDSLAPRDTNGEVDVYEWFAEGVGGCGKATGCVGPISGGKSDAPSTFVDASADAVDAFFTTSDSLVGTDPGSLDLYTARIGGGFPEPPTEIPCFGDACQPLPAEPDDPTPGTLFIGSESNPKLRFQRQGEKKRHHRHHKKGKHRRRGKHRKGASR